MKIVLAPLSLLASATAVHGGQSHGLVHAVGIVEWGLVYGSAIAGAVLPSP